MTETDPQGRWTQTERFHQAIRARDHSAWTLLASECYPLLLRYAVRNLPSNADAENAVQESVYRAFRKARRYDPSRPPFPWIAGFCVRECQRQRRSLGRRFRKPEWDAVRENERPHVADAEARRSVEAALEALPQRQYEVLNLRFGFRLSVREIADVLGIGFKSAETALTRGLLRLRTGRRSDELRDWLACLEGERGE